jgi:hypothetical protein
MSKKKNEILKSFNPLSSAFKQSHFQRIIFYVGISILLLLLSLKGLTAFMTIMVIMGISALIARWYSGTETKSKVRKYAETMTWLGLVNVILLLMAIREYDYATDRIGNKISTQIENYQAQNGHLPDDIKTINRNLNFNLLEELIVDKIKYRIEQGDYFLELTDLFDFDKYTARSQANGNKQNQYRFG